MRLSDHLCKLLYCPFRVLGYLFSLPCLRLFILIPFSPLVGEIELRFFPLLGSCSLSYPTFPIRSPLFL